ncbi:MAG: ATP-binding cassette domain-containing protein, partial [Planctomycetes bacterium]|nr:ATP-binding cassette domain-containing protein [Planctomycetota bacterium]
MIVFEQVCKTFPGGTEAVRELTLEVAEGETLVLLGTSGSGKTTTMKMVNRLIETTSGRILIDGRDVMEQDVIELRRRIGYAIQHIGLFSHMTIGENIAVVPKLLQWPRPQIDERIDQLLEMMGLEGSEFRDRFPSQLSGGQRQRVGVARALAADPPIVLMEERFGALVPITREQLQNEFL